MKAIACAGTLAGILLAGTALAQTTLQECYERYKGAKNDVLRDRQRLECYDALATKAAPAARQSLDDEWLLGTGSVAHLRAHRPSYLMWRWTDAANQAPSSPAAGHSVALSQQWQPGELKFQLSAKADVLRLGFDDQEYLKPLKASGFDTARLWLAFTQQSHWQALNGQRSAAFRETNYEPEAILTLRRIGWDDPSRWFKLLNIGLSHQSNGRPLPESRSWNRLYVQGGFEHAGVTLMPRAWLRLQESDDDNPDLTSHVGRIELLARKGDLSVLVRTNLNLGAPRSYAQIDWALPEPGLLAKLAIGPTRWFLQLSSGYSESLIDYNHRQTTIGLGLAYGLGER